MPVELVTPQSVSLNDAYRLSAPENIARQQQYALDSTTQLGRGWKSAGLSEDAQALLDAANDAGRRGDRGLQAALEMQGRDRFAQAAQWAPTTQRLTDVNSVGSAMDWVGGALGNARSSIQPAAGSVVGTGLGAAAGMLLKNPGAGARIGGFLGGAGAGYNTMANENVASAMMDPQIRATRSLQEIKDVGRVVGAAQAIPEALVPMGVARSLAGMGGKEAAGEIAKRGAARHIAGAAGVDALGEFGTEFVQNPMGDVGKNYLRGDPLGNIDWKEAVNAGAAGAVAGGGMGVVSGVADAAHAKLQNNVVQPTKELVNDPLGKASDFISDAGGKLGELAATATDPNKKLTKQKLQEMEDAIVGGVKIDTRGMTDDQIMAALDEHDALSAQRAEAHASHVFGDPDSSEAMRAAAEQYGVDSQQATPGAAEAYTEELKRARSRESAVDKVLNATEKALKAVGIEPQPKRRGNAMEVDEQVRNEGERIGKLRAAFPGSSFMKQSQMRQLDNMLQMYADGGGDKLGPQIRTELEALLGKDATSAVLGMYKPASSLGMTQNINTDKKAAAQDDARDAADMAEDRTEITDNDGDWNSGVQEKKLPNETLTPKWFGKAGSYFDTTFQRGKDALASAHKELADKAAREGRDLNDSIVELGAYDHIKQTANGKDLRAAEDMLLAKYGKGTRTGIDKRTGEDFTRQRAEDLASLNKTHRVVIERSSPDTTPRIKPENVEALRLEPAHYSKKTKTSEQTDIAKYGRVYVETADGKHFLTSAPTLIKTVRDNRKLSETGDKDAASGIKENHESFLAGLGELMGALPEAGVMPTGRIGVRVMAGGQIKWMNPGDKLPGNFSFFYGEKDRATVADLPKQMAPKEVKKATELTAADLPNMTTAEIDDLISEKKQKLTDMNIAYSRSPDARLAKDVADLTKQLTAMQAKGKNTSIVERKLATIETKRDDSLRNAIAAVEQQLEKLAEAKGERVESRSVKTTVTDDYGDAVAGKVKERVPGEKRLQSDRVVQKDDLSATTNMHEASNSNPNVKSGSAKAGSETGYTDDKGRLRTGEQTKRALGAEKPLPGKRVVEGIVGEQEEMDAESVRRQDEKPIERGPDGNPIATEPTDVKGYWRKEQSDAEYSGRQKKEKAAAADAERKRLIELGKKTEPEQIVGPHQPIGKYAKAIETIEAAVSSVKKDSLYAKAAMKVLNDIRAGKNPGEAFRAVLEAAEKRNEERKGNAQEAASLRARKAFGIAKDIVDNPTAANVARGELHVKQAFSGSEKVTAAERAALNKLEAAMAEARKKATWTKDDVADAEKHEEAMRANSEKTSDEAKPLTAEQKQEIIDDIKKSVGDEVMVEVADVIMSPDGHSQWSGDWQENLIRIAMGAMDKLGVGRHEAMHQFFSWARQHGGEKATAILENVAKNPLVMKQLKILLADHPAALEQLRNSPEEAAAFLYQFWRAGQITLGPKAVNLFQRVSQWLQKVHERIAAYFGNEKYQTAVEQREAFANAERIMAAFAMGSFSKSDERSAVFEALNNLLVAQENKRDNERAYSNGMQRAMRKAMFSAGSLFEDSKNPHLKGLGERFNLFEGQNQNKQPYFERHAQVLSQKQTQLRNILHKYDKDVVALAGKYLRERRPLNEIHHPEARQMTKEVRKFLSEMHQYLTDSGTARWDGDKKEWVPIGEVKENYYPRIWSSEKMMKNADAFLTKLEAALVEHRKQGGYPEITEFEAPKMAQAIMNRLINGHGAEEITESSSDLGVTPFMAAVNKRDLSWLKDEDFQEFMSDDVVHALTNYTAQAVKRAEYVREFGNGGEQIANKMDSAVVYELGGEKLEADANDKLHDMMKKFVEDTLAGKSVARPTLRSAALSVLRERAVKDGKTESEAFAAVSERETAVLKKLEPVTMAVQAYEGTLGHDIDPRLRQALSALTTYQNFRQLTMSLFGSITDPLGMVVRGGELKDAWDGFVRGMREIKLMWNNEFSQDEMAKLAEQLGTVEAGNYLDAIGQTYSSMFMFGKLRTMNDALFKWNGMEAWNRAMRIQATGAAVNFIKRHMEKPNEHSERYLKELFGDRKVPALVDGELDFSRPEVKEAVMRWVNGAILRPNAAHRPVHASDPHYMAFYHLKQFSYSFHKTILRRAVNEAKNGNYGPGAALFTTFIPIAVAADVVKEVLIPGDEPAWMKNGLGAYFRHGFERANVLGIPGMYLGQWDDPAMWFGPTANEIQDFASIPFMENHTMPKELLGALPGGSLFRRLAQ